MSTVQMAPATVVTRDEFVGHVGEWLQKVEGLGELQIVDALGELAIVISPEFYSEFAAWRIHAGVLQGIADMEAGRGVDHETAKAEVLAAIQAVNRR